MRRGFLRRKKKAAKGRIVESGSKLGQPPRARGMDVAIIAGAISLAAAIAGYCAGKKRRPINHTRELQKIGGLLGVPRLRRESNDDYAARLREHMQTELR